MTTNPSREEHDAMVAFLASFKGNYSLEERARLWLIAEEKVQKQMQQKNLVSGSNEINTKYRGAVE